MSYLRLFIKNVSVEPVMFLFFLTMVFSACLSTNLLLYKACDPSGAIAQRIGSKCDNETEAQHVVAPINGWKMLSQQLVPIVLATIAGTWSDRHGRCRRPLMVLPIVGQIIADALSVYSSVQWSVSPAVTGIMQGAALSFSGGLPMLFNGVNSYVADTTSEEWRTVKYGVLGGVMAIGGILGMLVYGFVVINVGFVSAFMMSVCLGIVALVLTFMFIDDACDTDVQGRTPGDEMSLFQNVIRTVNPLDVFRNCYRVLIKPRQGHGTTILCLVVLLCAPLTCVPLEGEMSIMYLFLRYKFQWNEVQFSIFNAYQMSIVLLGTIFALAILSHKFQMDDALIGMIASIFDLLAAIAFFMVSQSWELYMDSEWSEEAYSFTMMFFFFFLCTTFLPEDLLRLFMIAMFLKRSLHYGVPPLELFRGAALALTSSIASKCVGPNELGAMNSVKLLMESSMKGGFIPLYNFVYNRTFESIPSAFFIISIVLTAPLVVIFCTIYYLNRAQKSDDFDYDDKCRHQNNEISPINDYNNAVTSYHI